MGRVKREAVRAFAFLLALAIEEAGLWFVDRKKESGVALEHVPEPRRTLRWQSEHSSSRVLELVRFCPKTVTCKLPSFKPIQAMQSLSTKGY